MTRGGQLLAFALGATSPLAFLVACSEVTANDPAAECAAAVGIYKGLEETEPVSRQPLQTPGESVEIEYEGSDGMNIPVKGTAVCAFTVGKGGILSLNGAVVDGNPLGIDEVASIRSELDRQQ